MHPFPAFVPRNMAHLAHAIQSELLLQSALAMGRTAPNPAVAAVLLYRDPLGYKIFSGATERAGERHAEIVCLDAFSAFLEEQGLADATLEPVPLALYVSLEPCSHYGRTPPCTQRIMQELSVFRNKRLLIWEHDPSLGRSSLAILRKAGFHARKLSSAKKSKPAIFLSGFLGRLQGRGPRLHIKVACSSDGVMGLKGQRLRISGVLGNAFVHLMRAKCDAVIVGRGTVLADIPGLDLRLEPLLYSITGPSQKIKLNLAMQAGYPKSLTKLVRVFFKHWEQIIQAIVAQQELYQVQRIFVLGRAPERRREASSHAVSSIKTSEAARFRLFFQKQKAISEKTSKEPIYLVEKGTLTQWQSLFPSTLFESELPQLHSQSFGGSLRELLAQKGYNEVLVEGGHGFFMALRAAIDDRDIGYVLRSSQSLLQLLKGQAPDLDASLQHNKLEVPDFLASKTPLETFQLGNDKLELRNLTETL